MDEIYDSNASQQIISHMNSKSILRIYRSKSDIENLSRLRTSIPTEIDTNDYKGVIVNKPWGYEYLIYENQYVAIWILHLKHQHKTSMHCHPNKKTSYIVLSGTVVCSTLEGWTECKEGEGLIIDEGVFHCTKVLSEKGAIVMEIESPPNKKDLVRLKDEYGRENQGYEGIDKMSKHVDKYEYIDFHNLSPKDNKSKKLRNCLLSVRVTESDDIHKKLKAESGHILCLLQGKIHDADGSTVLSSGEAGLIHEINLRKKLIAFGEITYLTLDYMKDNE